MDLIAQLDQVGALGRSLATVFAQYRQGLIDNNIPVELADEMVRDYAKQLLPKLPDDKDGCEL